MVTDRDAPGHPPPGHPLAEREFLDVYAKVPRLTVEVVIRGPLGVLLTRRTQGPCAGLWHVPGGTVRFGEPLTVAVERVAAGELGLLVTAGPLLGYIEYPSHYLNGLDSPVGIAFLVDGDIDPAVADMEGRGWFTAPPSPMHAEQVEFLTAQGFLRTHS